MEDRNEYQNNKRNISHLIKNHADVLIEIENLIFEIMFLSWININQTIFKECG